MMPAAPPPAPNPFRAPLPLMPSLVPVLWLGARPGNPMMPPVGRNWIN